MPRSASSLISKSIPNLLGGVSQQPDATRFDNQCSAQDNGFSSVLDGLTKRPPTEHVGVISDTLTTATPHTGNEEYFTHIINLDSDHQYVLVIKADASADPTVIVKRITANGSTVEDVEVRPNTDTIRDYLNVPAGWTADTALRAITIADYTFILNRSKTVALTADVDTANNPEALFYIKTGEYGTKYTAEVKIGSDVYKTEVTTPSGVQTKSFDSDTGALEHNSFDARDAISTDNIASAFFESASDTSEPNTRTYSAIGFNTADYPINATNSKNLPDGGTVKEWKNGDTVDVELVFAADNDSDKIDFTEAVAAPAADAKITVGSIEGDWNFATKDVVVDDLILVYGSEKSAHNGVWYKVTARSETYNEISVKKADGTPATNIVDTSNEKYVRIFRYRTGSGYIAFADRDKVGIRNAVFPAGSVEKEREGSVLWLRSPSASEDFSITATDGMGDTCLIPVKAEIDKLSSLPTVAPNNFFVKVLGSADSTVDDYYVKFTADNGSFSSGTYAEHRMHGVKYKIDPATMPLALVKVQDTEFCLTQLDGVQKTGFPVTPGPQTYTPPAWTNRLTGDETSNPNPTFIGKTINDIFLFKNRLGFLADENVILSETAEFFNFFRTTVLDLLDTAPIDVASTHSRVSILTSAVPFSRQLVLFSDTSQFVLGSGQATLTPKTVTMTQTTSYESVTDLKPLSLGSSIYFGFSRGDYSGVKQYLRSNDTETVFEADDISSQIPQYMKGSLRQIAGSTNENVLFVTSDSDRNVLYCYKYFDRPDGGRVQSSWGRFLFPIAVKSSPSDADVSLASILGIGFIDASLYIITRRKDGIYLERLRLESGLVDSGSTYRTLLDRRITNSSISFSGDGKTLTLPYKVYNNENSPIEIITTAGARIPVLTQPDAGLTVTVGEDLSSTSFFAGEAYTFTYEFSDLVLRETTMTNDTALISQGRKQIRYLSLDYNDTGYFSVSVQPEFGDASIYACTGRILGAPDMTLGSIPLDSGVFRVPVYSKANQVILKILNDSPVPCAITSAEFELLYNSRSTRYS